ncbi:MAG: IPT/TIG domain-containing protein, partial [Chloroflexota bacterium]
MSRGLRAHGHLQLALGIALVVGSIGHAGASATAAPPTPPASGAPGPVVDYPVHMDLSAPLASIEGAQNQQVSARGNDRAAKKFGPDGQSPVTGVTGSAPAQPPVVNAPATATSWDGVGQGFSGPAGTFTVAGAPPDPNGAVGPNHYVQTVNTSFAIFNKTGTVLYGPVATNTLWAGFGGGCQIDNDGDATVVYDPIADRWVINQFAVTTTLYLNCVAVSQTSDPTGAYYRYSYLYSNFPDYPKLGIWPDGYYISFNMFAGGATFNGGAACSYDRAKMLSGLTAAQICFFTSNLYGGLLPATLDGRRLPPAGAPNYFVALTLGLTSTLFYWKFHADFATPANSTFSGPNSLGVAAYAKACNGGTCIPQSGTNQKLDSLADRLMYRLAYRNFGDHESLVVNHSIVAGSSVGVRWYELRVSGGNLSVYQQGTYAPDAMYRWMGSAAMDQAGDIALGFSVSSSSTHPAVDYTGRLAGDALGTMTQGEGSVIAGLGSQNGGLSRWGDYSSLSIDPVDDCTFWYTNEYLKANGRFNWSTRIASFKFPSCGVTVTSVNPSSGPVSGGTAVTITGTNFSSGATVSFGGVAPTTPVVVVNATTITTTTPAHAAGAVDVTVTAGSQSGTCSSCFTYIPPPTVTAINPTSGPATGGTVVTITGTGFDPAAGATTVHFGASTATGVSCASTINCTATSPAGSGTVDVTVAVGGQTSAANAADVFTYLSLSAAALAASYSSTPPTSWTAGQTQTYTISVTNTGSQTWNATGANPVRLGVHFGTTDDGWGVGWATDQRFGLPADLAPGASVTLTVAVTAPGTSGSYVLRHRMVKEYVAWFDQIQKTNVTV